MNTLAFVNFLLVRIFPSSIRQNFPPLKFCAIRYTIKHIFTRCKFCKFHKKLGVLQSIMHPSVPKHEYKCKYIVNSCLENFLKKSALVKISSFTVGNELYTLRCVILINVYTTCFYILINP